MARESDEDTAKESNEQNHDQEKGDGKEQKGSVGFWSKDLKVVRAKVVKKWCITSEFLEVQYAPQHN